METIKLPAQTLEAQFAAADANRDERVVPMVAYSGAKVLQFNWQNGLHELTLSMDPKHVRLDKLNTGRAPFTKGHADNNDPTATLGVIQSGTARLVNGQLEASVRFSKRPDVEPVYNDVLDGILPNVSVGANMYKVKETTPQGAKTRQFVATDWEPFAVALVGIGADPNAHFTAAATDAVECEIECAARATSPKEQQMPESIINAGEQARPEVNPEQIALAERNRTSEILNIATLGKLDVAFAKEHMDKGTSVDEFRKLAFEKLATRSEEHPTRAHAVITRDEVATRRELAGAQIMNLFDSKNAVDSQNPFRGRRVSRIAEDLLEMSGVNTRGMAPSQIAELSMHATGDFPLILADSARKQMLAAYNYATPTYKTWAKASTAPDFKTMSRLRLSETPSFLAVPEGAKIALSTMSESREQYAISTYGRGVAFTRQMLINDDLGAFNDIISAFGIQASRLENKTVYAVLNANAAMADGTALFHADHSNLGTGVIGNTALDAAWAAMKKQKGMDGVTVLNLEPQFLIVPVAKRMTAEQAMIASPGIKATDQNMFAGRFTVVSDAELDGTSVYCWYLACNPAVAPCIEYAHLEGSQGPQIIRTENENAVLGVQLYAFLDFGAKAVDYRTMYKSSGQ